MGKVRPGNKKNSKLNGEWATHVRKGGKKATAGLRRAESKIITKEKIDDSIKEEEDNWDTTPPEL
jgi:hypothetical protein